MCNVALWLLFYCVRITGGGDLQSVRMRRALGYLS